MAIQALRISHLRSVADVEITFGSLNAFVGRNNAGKSNILLALRVLLGETWPSRPFSEIDFHNHDTSSPIIVAVLFDECLQCDPAVRGFQLTYGGADSEVEYVVIDGAWTPLIRQYGPKRVSKLMREEVALLSLDIGRQAEQQLRPNQWTLYGKLLRQIESRLEQKERDQFRSAVMTAFTDHLSAGTALAEATISDFVQKQTGLSPHYS
jgi:hypothetical protein